MNRKKPTLLTLALLNTLTLTVGLGAYAVDPKTEISRSLVCLCGCGMVVYDCYCDLAEKWKTQIAEDLAAGKTKRQIIDGFVERYGDQVLATPRKSGLELTIWTIPVFASILGTVVIYRYARRKAPIPTSEIGAPILEPGEAPSEEESALQRYDEIYYEEYMKARKGEG